MNRINESDLEMVCRRINRAAGTPERPYVDGKPQARCFHIDHAYGGVALHQMCDEGTGVHDISRIGHVPKRELYNWMHAYLSGMTRVAA